MRKIILVLAAASLTSSLFAAKPYLYRSQELIKAIIEDTNVENKIGVGRFITGVNAFKDHWELKTSDGCQLNVTLTFEKLPSGMVGDPRFTVHADSPLVCEKGL